MSIEPRPRPDLVAAAELGARTALARLGLADENARRDMDDLRELLSAWRDAKSVARKTVVEWFVRGVLAVLLVVLVVKTGLTEFLFQ